MLVCGLVLVVSVTEAGRPAAACAEHVWLAGQFASVIVGIHMQTYSFHAMAQRRRPQRPCVPTPCLDQRVRHGHDNPLVILGQNIKFMT